MAKKPSRFLCGRFIRIVKPFIDSFSLPACPQPVRPMLRFQEIINSKNGNSCCSKKVLFPVFDIFFTYNSIQAGKNT